MRTERAVRRYVTIPVQVTIGISVQMPVDIAAERFDRDLDLPLFTKAEEKELMLAAEEGAVDLIERKLGPRGGSFVAATETDWDIDRPPLPSRRKPDVKLRVM